MQVELSQRAIKLLHEVKGLFKKEIPSYNASSTQLVNQLVEDALQHIVDTKKKGQ